MINFVTISVFDKLFEPLTIMFVSTYQSLLLSLVNFYIVFPDTFLIDLFLQFALKL